MSTSTSKCVAQQLDARLGDLLPDEDARGVAVTGALERLERGGDGDAAHDLCAELGERQLDGGERGRDVEDVEPADVADPEDLALEARLAGRERDAEAVAQAEHELAGVDAFGRVDRGHDGGGVLVGREQLQAHRLGAGAVARPRRTWRSNAVSRPSLEQDPHRHVEAAMSGTAGVNGESILSCAFWCARPVEVEAARGLASLRAAPETDTIASPGGVISAFCEPETTASSPQASVSRARRRGSRSRRRRARASPTASERLDVGDDAGRGLGLLAEHDARRRTRAGGPDLVRFGRSPQA